MELWSDFKFRLIWFWSYVVLRVDALFVSYEFNQETLKLDWDNPISWVSYDQLLYGYEGFYLEEPALQVHYTLKDWRHI